MKFHICENWCSDYWKVCKYPVTMSNKYQETLEISYCARAWAIIGMLWIDKDYRDSAIKGGGAFRSYLIVFFSALCLASTVSLTTSSHLLQVVRQMKIWKTLISSTTATVHHILYEENSNRSDKSSCQRPPWSSPPCCPCSPQCRRPPNHRSRK